MFAFFKRIAFFGQSSCPKVVPWRPSFEGLEDRVCPDSGSLLGVTWLGSSADAFVKVDPSAGQLQVLSTIPWSGGRQLGELGTLDPVGPRYFYPLGDRLFVLDTRTGGVLAAPPRLGGVSSLKYDACSGRLFGVAA